LIFSHSLPLCFWDNYYVSFLAKCLLNCLQNNHYSVWRQLVSELQHFSETSTSSVSMAGGRGGNVQDVMIEDLQRQVAELTQRLVAQEVSNREMENSDSDSTLTTRITILLHSGSTLVGKVIIEPSVSK
jgi:hypothetical protein